MLLGAILALLGGFAVIQPGPAYEALQMFGPSVRLAGLCFILLAGLLAAMGWWLAGISFVVEPGRVCRNTRFGQDAIELASVQRFEAPFGGVLGLKVRQRDGVAFKIPLETRNYHLLLDQLTAALKEADPKRDEPDAIARVRNRVIHSQWRRECLSQWRSAIYLWALVAAGGGAISGWLIPSPWTVDFFTPGWIMLGIAGGLLSVGASLAVVLRVASRNALPDLGQTSENDELPGPADRCLARSALMRSLRFGVATFLLIVALPSAVLWMCWQPKAEAINEIRRLGGDVSIIPWWVHEHREVNLASIAFTDETLPDLTALGRLNDLNLNGCNISDEQLVAICGTLGIEQLQLRHATVDGSGLSRIEQRGQVETLMLGSSAVMVLDETVNAVSQLSQLNQLDLGSTHVTDAGLARLSTLPRLSTLNISGTPIEGNALSHLAALPMLEQLDAVNTRIDDRDVVGLSGAPALRRLNLSKTRVTDRSFQPLAAISTLTHLRLQHTYVLGQGVSALANCQYLIELDVSDTAFDDVAAEEMESLQTLLSLDLERTKVTNDGLKYVGRIRSLQILDLSGTAIDDAGLAHLTQLHDLRSLNLSRTAVTEQGLQRIASLGNLMQVKVRDTSISPRAIERFNAALPGVSRAAGLTR